MYADLDQHLSARHGAPGKDGQVHTAQTDQPASGGHHPLPSREHDERQNAHREADANLRAAQAALQTARLNLSYTQVRAPVSNTRYRDGLVSQRKKSRVATGMVLSKSRYSASASIIACSVPSPATPSRSSQRRRSRVRSRSASTLPAR